MGFQDVKRAENQARGARNEEGIQRLLQAGGQDVGGGKFAFSGGEGSHGGDANFYDDPTVNAVAKLPSQAQAEQYTGARPSFYGVQRPGDWQRVVQRQMAADALPGGQEQLAKLTQGRVDRERARSGMP